MGLLDTLFGGGHPSDPVRGTAQVVSGRGVYQNCHLQLVASGDAIRRLASEAGMRAVRENGLEKVASGETSLAEVARATG